jgi:CheY-like chemotaxis protein
VFTFTLVLDGADTRSPRAESPSERTLPGLEPEPLPRSLRVLVAEDNAVNQILIQAILDKLGHRSDVVGNGLEVLAQLRQATYDVVLMDVQMPDMDGLAATAEIRRQEAAEGRPRLPVVAMTAHAMAEDRKACLDAGMDDHLSKPVDVEQLAIAIRRVQRRSAQPAPAQG